jgi:simple sugar transport system permease protein
MNFFKNFFTYRSSSVFLIFIGLVLIFIFFSPEHRFISPENIDILLAEGSEFSIVVLGIGLLMICGEFDLSLGSILVFCAFIFFKFFQAGMNLFLAAGIILFIGAILGLLNGLITTKGYISSFITTLGTRMFWRGLMLLLSKGFTTPIDRMTSPLFCHILTGKIGGFVPVQVIWFIAVVLILGFLLHSHKFGNWVYAAGGNKLAARAMGINTDWVKITCFIIVGVLSAFVGVMQVIRVSAFFPQAGAGWELKAIASSVVGGTALMGGKGSMVGIFLGALIIAVIENALVMLRIPYFYTHIVFALVIITSVLLSRHTERRRLRHG